MIQGLEISTLLMLDSYRPGTRIREKGLEIDV